MEHDAIRISWIYLIVAIVLEVSGTLSMKLSEGFSKLVPSIAMLVFYLLGLSMLALALRKIDVSIAYAVWSGLGTAIIALVGILWFEESVTLLKIISLSLIIAGVVGLSLATG